MNQETPRYHIKNLIRLEKEVSKAVDNCINFAGTTLEDKHINILNNSRQSLSNYIENNNLVNTSFERKSYYENRN
ncbi:hypothetical protein CN457_27775 [Bacillus cereus]|uniref:hypothetical protein n=1 Tax=Bacillus cereus TaxID=1396 RepID=UPI000BF8B00B|nr:hypothetical protein [Bacillus cereus]PEX73453.1 hypothetical protein CN457_27775 [Bacillus cereus]